MIRHWILAAGLMLLGACAQTSPSLTPRIHAPAEVSLPLHWLRTGDIGGLPLVEVTLAGRITTWILDTGAGAHVISETLASELALASDRGRHVATIGGRAQGREVTLPTLCLAQFCIESASAIAMDLTAYGAQTGREVHGIIGAPLLREAELQIDFRVPSLTLRQFTDPPARADSPNWPQGVPTLELTLDAHPPTRALFDTGNAGALVLFAEFSQRAALLHDMTHLPRLTRSELGGDAGVYLGRFARVQGDGWVRTEVSAAVEAPRSRGAPSAWQGLGGSVGTAMFDHARVTVNHRAGTVRVKSADSTPVPGGFGLVLDPTPDGLKIAHILAKSPAAQAGVEVGDRLVTVDALAVTSPHALWAYLADRSQALFGFERGGETRTIALNRAWFLPRFALPRPKATHSAHEPQLAVSLRRSSSNSRFPCVSRMPDKPTISPLQISPPAAR